MKTIRSAVLAAGLVASLPVLAQTAGNTPNTGPQGTGNFVAGKPEGEGTSYVGGKPKERDANYARPEGEGTNYVGGRPADKAK
jgi:hypothetical protein